MSLTNEEKGLVEEALSVYLQLVSRQVPPQQVQQIAAMAQGIIGKLDSVGVGGGRAWQANHAQRIERQRDQGERDNYAAHHRQRLRFFGILDSILDSHFYDHSFRSAQAQNDREWS
jgi:hypothetical protein